MSAAMFDGPTLRSKIDQRALVIGSWTTLGDAAVAEIMAKAGLDFLVIDLEHSTLALDQTGNLIRTIDLCGVAPLVRLTSNNADQIKRVMDAGAHGIVVPMVNSAAEAKAAVAATRYAPRGSRGVGLGRAQEYGRAFERYLAWQSDGPVVIVQIEHCNAIPHLDEILAVPGVDGLIIGPYDLSCSMGAPGEFERPEFKDAITSILDAGRRARTMTGFHMVEPDPARLRVLIDEGYTFIAYSVDFRILAAGIDIGIRTARGTKS